MQFCQFCLQKAKGRKRNLFDDKVYKLSVKRGEIETIEMLKSEVRVINQEIEKFKKMYDDLEKEKSKLYEEIILEVNKLDNEVCELKDVNKELMDYTGTLEKMDSLQCQWKTIQNIGKKQKLRKVRLLKNLAQCALWFCESYGL